ncbi:ATP-binding domain-containing protein [Alishewanella sp. HL-SH05]|uniref:ATP-binding domain-containing protein n=1 Tax=Alishewanella sp. HL-SH05 TaxID=3461145 RepID=UPI0040431FEB
MDVVALVKFKKRFLDTSLTKFVCMTYRKSKGKQAEHCYVFDPTFSNYSLGTVKEELCNTYVAFTRAKTHLTIIASKAGHAMYGTTDKKEVSKSIFAKLPDELIQFNGCLTA